MKKNVERAGPASSYAHRHVVFVFLAPLNLFVWSVSDGLGPERAGKLPGDGAIGAAGGRHFGGRGWTVREFIGLVSIPFLNATEGISNIFTRD